MSMAATTTGMQVRVQVQVQAALLLCLVVLAASPRVALGNCRDDCMAACNGWPVVCQLSCTSACYGGEVCEREMRYGVFLVEARVAWIGAKRGHSRITTLSTSAESATAEAPASASAPPAAAQKEEGGGGVSVLRGLKPSPARG